MAVSTTAFPKATAHPQRAERCGGSVMPCAASGVRRGEGAAGMRGSHAGHGDGSVSAAAEAILLRERLRSQQLLAARPLTAARRPGGPVECYRSAPVSGYRLSRWERLGMTLVVAAAVVVVAVSSFGQSSVPTRDAVVLPGDTMLSIALREMPELDPARAVELIGAANGSADLRIVPGSTLQIPAAP
jgi:hypothetical protein